jgi:hypothetical protein
MGFEKRKNGRTCSPTLALKATRALIALNTGALDVTDC